MKLDPADLPDIIGELSEIARRERYAKIFIKIPVRSVPWFKADGYIIEAVIPRLFRGVEDGCFMSKFLDSDRVHFLPEQKLYELGALLMEKQAYKGDIALADRFSYRRLTVSDIEQMISVYREVFRSYPFPIHDSAYLQKLINTGEVQFFGVFENTRDKLVAISSAEADREGRHAEMTDFATLPEYRGNKLSVFLLKKMEEAMQQMNIDTVFTIARLQSIPMNKTFLSQNYAFGGTLINNTHIAGSIESMNILYKHL